MGQKECREIYAQMEKTRGFDKKAIGAVSHKNEQYPLIVLSTQSPGLPNVFLSAGIHGNEISGTYALLRFLQQYQEEYKDCFNFIAIPLANPTGVLYDIRENYQGIDLNREFDKQKRSVEVDSIKQFLRAQNQQYVFSIDFHEDVVPKGEKPVDSAYLFETCAYKNQIGQDIMISVAQRGIEVCTSRAIDGLKSNNGAIWTGQKPSYQHENKSMLEGYMQNHTRHSFTLEIPQGWNMSKKIAANIETILVALEVFTEKSQLRKAANE